jgi:hypothetical protein
MLICPFTSLIDHILLTILDPYIFSCIFAQAKRKVGDKGEGSDRVPIVIEVILTFLNSYCVCLQGD